MKKVFVPVSEKIEIVHTKEAGKFTEVSGVALIIYYTLGMGFIEDLLKPILTELHLDHERFFKAFWAHVQKVALSE